MSSVSDLCERLFSVPDLCSVVTEFAAAMVLRAARQLASESDDLTGLTEGVAREMLASVVLREREAISLDVARLIQFAIDTRDRILGSQLAVNIMADGNVLMVLDEAKRIKATPIN